MTWFFFRFLFVLWCQEKESRNLISVSLTGRCQAEDTSALRAAAPAPTDPPIKNLDARIYPPHHSSFMEAFAVESHPTCWRPTANEDSAGQRVAGEGAAEAPLCCSASWLWLSRRAHGLKLSYNSYNVNQYLKHYKSSLT